MTSGSSSAAGAGRSRAAADEGDDLDLVAVGERRLGPGPAGDDVLVAFDRHARRVDAHGRQQAGNRGAARRGTRLSVDRQAQVVHLW